MISVSALKKKRRSRRPTRKRWKPFGLCPIIMTSTSTKIPLSSTRCVGNVRPVREELPRQGVPVDLAAPAVPVVPVGPEGVEALP